MSFSEKNILISALGQCVPIWQPLIGSSFPGMATFVVQGALQAAPHRREQPPPVGQRKEQPPRREQHLRHPPVRRYQAFSGTYALWAEEPRTPIGRHSLRHARIHASSCRTYRQNALATRGDNAKRCNERHSHRRRRQSMASKRSKMIVRHH
jgi:hypothetical protein